MTEYKVDETALAMVQAIRGANEAIADSAVVAQERNIKYAQSIFLDGIEVLKSHGESTRSLIQELVEQSQKQQAAFQALLHEAVDAYVGFLYAPLSYYKQAADYADVAVR